ncbi:MAG: energy-coupling factor ABC transporter permease [Ignavibacteriales bacterium]
MTHLHIPDAAIPGRIAVAGYALMALALSICLWTLRNSDARRSTALTGIVGAFMLLAMSVPLGPVPVHLNLAALAGVLLGPAMALICVFSVNLILALAGHGGITVVGLNTIVLGVQAVTAGWLFSRLYGRFGGNGRGAGVYAGLSTMVSVLLSLAVVFGVVSAAAIGEGPLDAHGVERTVALGGPIGLLGAVLESLVVAAIATFLERVRPDLLLKQR